MSGARATIWKFKITIDDEFEILLPAGSRILDVQAQGGTSPCIWALVDPVAAPEPRRFRLAGTGHTLDDPETLAFIGTFQLRGGALVFHLFERTSAA
jgi:hypothetical protein